MDALITKLKGVAENKNLELFDAFRAVIYPESTMGVGVVRFAWDRELTFSYKLNGANVEQHYQGRGSGNDVYFSFQQINAPTECIVYPQSVIYNLLCYNIRYDINIYAFKQSLTNIDIGDRLSDNNPPHLYGSINSLGRLINLTSLNINRSECYGNIDQLARDQISFGRTSGTLAIYANDGAVASQIYSDSGARWHNAFAITFDTSLEKGYSISNI